MQRYRIAVIAGDGIGREVIPAGSRVLDAVASRHGVALQFTEFPWGCDYYGAYGRMMPDGALDELRGFVRKYHIDALAARMITHPQSLDVIVASNLFGDILTDIGSAISGSMGVAPGANINPERTAPSMFEPIHGSAPDIAGKGIANPIGAIWAGALMLDHLGQRAGHDEIVAAISRVLSENGPRTPDLGGAATTDQVTAAVLAQL